MVSKTQKRRQKWQRQHKEKQKDDETGDGEQRRENLKLQRRMKYIISPRQKHTNSHKGAYATFFTLLIRYPYSKE